MKNSEIIQTAALIALAAILLYRKYGKKSGKKDAVGTPGTTSMPFRAHEEEYEPYSKKNKPVE